MKRCPFCAEEIQDAAIVCRFCGRDLATGATPSTGHPGPNPGVAAVLSLVIPGAGQMYAGRVGGGLVWLVVVVIGYVLFFPIGAFFHLCAVLDASGVASRAAATATRPTLSGTTCPTCGSRRDAVTGACRACEASRQETRRPESSHTLRDLASVTIVVIVGLALAFAASVLSHR